MTSILRTHRKKGSVGLILVGATAAISLLLMFNAIFLPSNQVTPIGARAATITTLYPVADTMLKKDSPNHNYGSSVSLSCQGDDERIAYFKFDLSSLANNRIISAKLNLQLLGDGGSNAGQYIEHVENSDWQENSITYNSVYSGTDNSLKPSQIVASLNGGNPSELLQILITQIVTEKAGSFLTLACVPKDLTDGDDLKFNSRESTSGKPALIIESEPLPTPTPLPTIAPTGSTGGFGGIMLGQTVSGTVYVTLYTDQASTDYVKFYIDDTFINEEHVYPFSLGGDTNGTVNGYDTRKLTNGQHILKAEIFYKDGTSEIYQVNFNVLNNPTSTPTCIPLPSCAWPGANPVCSIAPPPNGGGYCPAPTPTPTIICPAPTTPLCPNGSITSGTPDTNGCPRLICVTPTPTPSSCNNLVPPSGLIPEGTIPPGETIFTWSGQSAAIKYALRIDDLSNDFNFSYVNGDCVSVNPDDICIDNLETTTYTFTLKPDHTYRWWVHAINSCNNWSSAASVQVIAPIPTAPPTITNIPTFTPTPPSTPATITIISPTDNQTIEGNVVMVRYARSGNLNNIGTVRLKLNNQSEIIDTDNDGLYTFSAVAPGTYVLSIYLTDTQGNPLTSPEASKTITFNVTELPTPTLPSTNCALKPRGDADCDGKIDMIDFEIWRQEFIGSATTKDADFDSSVKVDLVDFEAWRQGFVASF